MFWSLWVFDALIGVVLLGSFVRSLSRSTVGSFNLGPWLLSQLLVAGVLWSSHAFRAGGHPTVAILILATLALPALLGALLFLLAVVVKPGWN